MPGADPTDWLNRLSPAEWLAAANTELEHAVAALTRRAARPGVTYARRAAGMAWNAVLVLAPEPRFGRSYMEHVVALASDDSAPADVRVAAQQLRDTPPLPPRLITLGKPDLAAADAARTILTYARQRVAALESLPH
jgi:hypothetical protein